MVELRLCFIKLRQQIKTVGQYFLTFMISLADMPLYPDPCTVWPGPAPGSSAYRHGDPLPPTSTSLCVEHFYCGDFRHYQKKGTLQSMHNRKELHTSCSLQTGYRHDKILYQVAKVSVVQNSTVIRLEKLIHAVFFHPIITYSDYQITK